MMARDDYEMLVPVLRKHLKEANASNDVPLYIALWELVEDMMDAFVSDNPRFDREKFVEAITINPVKVQED